MADAGSGPAWRERFDRERMLAVYPAREDPDRVVAVVKRGKEVEFVAVELSTGNRERLGPAPAAYADGYWTAADGRAVFRVDDPTGSELGHLVRLGVDGAGPDLTPDWPDYTIRGGEAGADGRLHVAATVDASGFTLALIDAPPDDSLASVRRLYHSRNEAWRPKLSTDGVLAAIDTTDHSPGVRRFGVTVFETESGARVGELTQPGEGSVVGVRFSPVPGDLRLLVSTRLASDGLARPAVWDPTTGDLAAIPVDAAGDVELLALDWSRDAERVLVLVEDRAKQHLAVVRLGDGLRTDLDLPEGSFWDPLARRAWFGAGDDVLTTHESAGRSQRLLRWSPGAPAEVVLDSDLPPGVDAQWVTFESADGTPVQAWLLTPPGPGPHPAVVHVHGGPQLHVVDAYNPAGQAWVDHGFAFLDVNFRGSTGRGRQFFEEIWGRVGELELDDVAAAADWLVSSGVARRDALVVTGASYGGFMTLLALGRQPERWAAGIAEVAIADWSIAYRDASAALQAAFRGWFGGEPGDVEERYRASSPITYVDGVRAPVLIRQGRHDSRTPAAQLETYADRLRRRGADLELDWFDAGHFLHVDADEMAHKVAFLRARGIAGDEL